MESALRELSASLCRGNHRIVAAYAALNVRMSGSALIPGLNHSLTHVLLLMPIVLYAWCCMVLLNQT